MTAPAAGNVDEAFRLGHLPLADAISTVLMEVGCPAIHEAFEMALAAYRDEHAGCNGREYPADSRAQAAVDFMRALGIEMSEAQRAAFWSTMRAEEVAAAFAGFVAAGHDRADAERMVARQFHMAPEDVATLLTDLHAANAYERRGRKPSGEAVAPTRRIPGDAPGGLPLWIDSAAGGYCDD